MSCIVDPSLTFLLVVVAGLGRCLPLVGVLGLLPATALVTLARLSSVVAPCRHLRSLA